jgi:hypothetical protein
MIEARRTAITAGAVAFVLGAFVLAACSTAATDATEACGNQAKDEGEEGIDCGGVCAKKCTGQACAGDEECTSAKCNNTTCAAPAGKPCGVGTSVAQCDNGQPCELDGDCRSLTCVNGTCAVTADSPPSHADGKKNLDETDVDCGGPTAPKCADGKACGADGDCVTANCPADKKVCVAPRYDDGVKNGTETDVDCGGTGAGMKKCAEDKICLVDADCNGACKTVGAAKTCIDAPSCKGHFGADTCGTNEVGSGAESHLGPTGTAVPKHESCCRTLPVASYTDPTAPGKTVYVDKYEITAGRMRAFLESIGGGVDAAGNALSPNVKAYMTAHRPSRWNNGWEDVLPTNNAGSQATYVVKYASGDGLYPGQDQYLANHPTQNTWWIRSTGPTATAKQGAGQQGTYTVETGVFYALGTYAMFPEYYADPAIWNDAGQGEGYAVNHALNCSNGHGAYGWSTYWFDDATVTQYNGFKKAYGANAMESKAIHDAKAMNCAPNALFAAFCAWDGGQLATAEVIDAITGNTVSPIYDSGPANDPLCQGGAPCQNGKLAAGKSASDGANNALCAGNTLNSFPDGTQGCYNVYYAPGDANDYDDSSKIAPPGRVPADVVAQGAGKEPWVDMIGNLQEVVLKKGTAETARFDYRGYGVEWRSIQHHHNQQTTARGKGGAFGARCMRFK